MSLTVYTAVTGAWEAPLVSALEAGRAGVAVVRRCVDLPDLLAAASTGRAQAVLLSADLRRLDREALGVLASAGLAVVGLYPPSDPDQQRRLRALGVQHVLSADASVPDIARAVEEAVLARLEDVGNDRAVSDPAAALAPLLPPVLPADHGQGAGRLLAVWGPVGSPGRTTVAVTVAAELAALGEPTLLVDADTYGASIAQTLGVLDEAPGIAAACRAAAAGTLEPSLLARLAPEVGPGLRVLTGISRTSRWPEVGGASLAELLAVARRTVSWTVVDCGFCLERDEELSYDTAAPRRNASTLTTLEHADVVLAVGSADPVGLQRLVRGLDELTEVVPAATPTVLVNRLRPSAVGPSPERRIAEALGRYAGVQTLVTVPDDRSACDAALMAGRSLTEGATGSPARRALAVVAADLAGARVDSATRRGRRRAG